MSSSPSPIRTLLPVERGCRGPQAHPSHSQSSGWLPGSAAASSTIGASVFHASHGKPRAASTAFVSISSRRSRAWPLDSGSATAWK